MLKSCLFDLDGVIVDTAKYHFLAWRRLADELGFEFTEDRYRHFMGSYTGSALLYSCEIAPVVKHRPLHGNLQLHYNPPADRLRTYRRYAGEVPVQRIGIGISWAAILALPYSILAKSLPSSSTGLYMGIFNFTITLPQIVCGLIGGTLVKYLFNG
ncbi:Haloacid dehalogenase-like hydrolase, partial [Popillia japonica]